ncbi:hypothetical protein F5144DRAFT_547375 [Chaetomium tenue]|uniref:Uncharacterized protein n=1 Tax=Chaetomium tenue TaxID=1854479 RepID=A0ACB7P720_9PEZI|nr:hypothetical protein F5144DRAFT_547375 [Chaetomium globosum]
MDHEDMVREPKWQIKTNMGKTRHRWEPRKSRNEAQGQTERKAKPSGMHRGKEIVFRGSGTPDQLRGNPLIPVIENATLGRRTALPRSPVDALVAISRKRDMNAADSRRNSRKSPILTTYPEEGYRRGSDGTNAADRRCSPVGPGSGTALTFTGPARQIVNTPLWTRTRAKQATGRQHPQLGTLGWDQCWPRFANAATNGSTAS